jgi:hypothetical protein
MVSGMLRVISKSRLEKNQRLFDLPNSIRNEAVKDPPGSSTLVAQEGGALFQQRKIFSIEQVF